MSGGPPPGRAGGRRVVVGRRFWVEAGWAAGGGYGRGHGDRAPAEWKGSDSGRGSARWSENGGGRSHGRRNCLAEEQLWGPHRPGAEAAAIAVPHRAIGDHRVAGAGRGRRVSRGEAPDTIAKSACRAGGICRGRRRAGERLGDGDGYRLALLKPHTLTPTVSPAEPQTLLVSRDVLEGEVKTCRDRQDTEDSTVAPSRGRSLPAPSHFRAESRPVRCSLK